MPNRDRADGPGPWRVLCRGCTGAAADLRLRTSADFDADDDHVTSYVLAARVRVGSRAGARVPRLGRPGVAGIPCARSAPDRHHRRRTPACCRARIRLRGRLLARHGLVDRARRHAGDRDELASPDAGLHRHDPGAVVVHGGLLRARGAIAGPLGRRVRRRCRQRVGRARARAHRARRPVSVERAGVLAVSKSVTDPGGVAHRGLRRLLRGRRGERCSGPHRDARTSLVGGIAGSRRRGNGLRCGANSGVAHTGARRRSGHRRHVDPGQHSTRKEVGSGASRGNARDLSRDDARLGHAIARAGRAYVEDVARAAGRHLLVGAPDWQLGQPRNSASLFDPHGRAIGRYDKRHLVPFGEYVPYHGALFFLDAIAGQGFPNFVPGAEPGLLSTPLGRLGVVICYEVIFPTEVRSLFTGGADILVNLTNDGWFGRSPAPFQHLAMSVFRAVENRTYLVRAANTGISAIVAPDGRIVRASGLFTREVIAGSIARRAETTFYTRHGDVFAWLAVAVAVAALPVRFRVRRSVRQRATAT
ncbi:MAG: apolipoprotein N-acyltransferase [Candidatus Rokuibacteriota bacterium]|nr:MAG: apolipoprotein N-acyltransferase [Candidatus Rokubacteria bacterium]